MFREPREGFRFEWSHLGDIARGRPNLGPTTSVAIYRLVQFTVRDAAIKHTDPETARRIFYDAGFTAGKAIYENLVGETNGLDALVATLQRILKELKIGILRFEETDAENMRFVLTVSEDLDCSGLPLMEEAICTYDEGLIAGILESFAGIPFEVKEVDCWCMGGRTCRFQAHAVVEGSSGRAGIPLPDTRRSR